MSRVWYEVRDGDGWRYTRTSELQAGEAEKMAAFFRRWPDRYRSIAVAQS